MSWLAIGVSMSIPRIVITSIALISCGDDLGITPSVDASIPIDADLCQCPGGDISPDLFYRSVKPYQIMGGSNFGLVWGCFQDPVVGELNPRMIGGGCGLQTPNPQARMTRAQFYTSTSGPEIGWACVLDNSNATGNTFYVTPLCVLPTVEPPPDEPPTDASPGDAQSVAALADECECPPAEPAERRFLWIEDTMVLRRNGVTTSTVRCDPGQQLIGGSCRLSHVGPFYHEVNLLSSGLTKDQSAWSCAWVNRSDSDMYSGTAMASCIRPPEPDTAQDRVPLNERIRFVETAATVMATNARHVEATCQPGDTLLQGGCTLDSPISIPDVSLYRAGYSTDPNRPNTWQCGWNNPTVASSPARATAICLTKE